jgi:hypothetical protein
MGEGQDGGDRGFMVHPHLDPPPSSQREEILARQNRGGELVGNFKYSWLDFWFCLFTYNMNQ